MSQKENKNKNKYNWLIALQFGFISLMLMEIIFNMYTANKLEVMSFIWI